MKKNFDHKFYSQKKKFCDLKMFLFTFQFVFVSEVQL